MIERVVPPYDFTDGGAEVVVEGGPFAADAEVKFGDEIAEVLDVSRGEIRVVVPEQGRAGTVDVSVSGATGSASLAAGFNYFDDGRGKTGIIGELSWTRYLGAYWQLDPVDSGVAWFSVISPVRLAHSELYGRAIGYCAANYEPPAFTPYAGVDPAALSAPGVSNLRLGWSAADSAFVSALDSSDFLTNTSYDLDGLVLPGFPEIDVEGVVQTPPSFNLTSPNLDGAVAPELGPATTVRWTGATGDGVLLVMGLHNGAGTAYEAVVSCVADPAVGEISVQGSDWSSWIPGRQVDVYLGVSRRSDATVPFNGSLSEFAGVYWLFGAGFSI